jgi:hypothetical protein
MSDTPSPCQTSQLSCTYCPKPGADACVRMTASSSGPSRPVYAHQACARDRGVTPIYTLRRASCVFCLAPDADEMVCVYDSHSSSDPGRCRYAHLECAAAYGARVLHTIDTADAEVGR